MKKYLKWMIPVVAVVVLVVAFLLYINKPAINKSAINEHAINKPAINKPAMQSNSALQEQVREIKIGWNVDREAFVDANGISTRIPSGENYRLRFAIDGQQFDLLFDSYELVCVADSMDVMGLKINEQGFVTEVLKPEEFCGGLALENYLVTEFTDTSVTCSLQYSGQSPSITFKITDDTLVYNIGDKGILCGIPGTIERGCRIWGLLDQSGALTHAYISSPFEKKPIYWNINRQYDSATKQTKRDSDVLGIYVYDFAVDGQQVQLKTRDFEVANKIDSYAARCMSLGFDEEGYIISADGSRNATGGNSLASWYHITDITDNGFTAQKYTAGADQGSVANGHFSSDCKIYDMSDRAPVIGAETELRLTDQVHCLRDSFGDVCVVFVVKRYTDGDIYWNVDRPYANGATTRLCDSEGWYYLRMLHDGKLMVLKTNEYDLVNFIDGRTNSSLILDGDVIVDAFATNQIYNGQTFCSWAKVTEVSKSGKITVDKDGQISQGVMAEDCKIYNVSEAARYIGVETDVRADDLIHALQSLDGTIHTVFVVRRRVDFPIYWNVSRQYDSVNKSTKRVPDENGWYHFTVAVNGKVEEVKTNKKEFADAIDAVSTSTLSLSVHNGVIMKVYKYTELQGFSGSVGGWYTVVEMKGNEILLEDVRSTSATYGKKYNVEIPGGIPVYNVSSVYTQHVGEPTEIKLGDQLFTLVNGDDAVYVLVVGRQFMKECQHCNSTVMWSAWNGKSLFENGGHYYLKDDIVQTGQNRINVDCSACFDLNGHNITISSDTGRAFNIYGTLNLMGEGTITATKQDVDIATVVYIQNGGTFNMYGGAMTAQYAANRAGIIMVQGNMNMYGGSVYGGKANGNGGNMEVLNTGVLTVYDGLISAGQAVNGGNIYSNGTVKILGGTVHLGVAQEGGNIHIKKGNLTLTDATVKDGTATGSGGNIKYDAENANEGTVTVNGASYIANGKAGGKGGNIYIRWTGKLYLGGTTVVTGGESKHGSGGILCYVCKPTISGSVQVTGNKDADLYLDGNDSSIATILISDLNPDARIGIFMLRPGSFAFDISQELLDCFFSSDENYNVVFEDGQLVLK